MIDRKKRARLALDGLSIGDAFGQQFFHPGVVEMATDENLPTPPWNYTDDTEMAVCVLQELERCGEIQQDCLATRFAERHASDPNRGYGAGAWSLLYEIAAGGDWRIASRELFGGSGSYGNGAAMRVAPLGAWFSDDIDKLIEQSELSATVTHAHPEGVAGAIAVALAAAWAWRRNFTETPASPTELIPWVVSHLGPSEVRRGLEWASTYELDTWAFTVASQVGSGIQISAQDTVPFCLWLAAANLDDYKEAMWTAARVGGDIDTNCAIVGGIVALNVGTDGIPETWRLCREPLSM